MKLIKNAKYTKRIFTLSAILTMAAFATSAQAVPFTLDTKIGFENMISDVKDEIERLNFYSGMNFDIHGGTQVQSADVTFMEDPEAPGHWVIDAPLPAPGYFVLKFGKVDGAYNHYFFQNIGELDKFVFSNQQVDFATGGCAKGGCNFGKLSHYTIPETFDEPPAIEEVPEPGSLYLLGLGLAGLLGGRRALRR